MAQAAAGVTVILVREETNPEDVEGMRAAEGILTARGGMTSHAALVARGWGKCCIVGAGAMKINLATKTMTAGAATFKAGDLVTLNGTKGLAYAGALAMIDATENPRFQQFMKLVDKHRTLGVRTNADTPEDAKVARGYGAEGIGLFRTEHMFYGKGADEPLFILRKMIMVLGKKPKPGKTKQAKEAAQKAVLDERTAVVNELFPFVKRSIKATLEAMEGLPVTVRLLDPPLHEFVPQDKAAQAELAKALGVKPSEIRLRGEELHESNPMMGHRGVRLGITYPEVTEMQVRAIFEAAAELIQAGKDARPEIMVPVTCDVRELEVTKVIVDRVHAEVKARLGVDVKYLYGTMIEIPRAALLADRMAKLAQFFSFGTNDLTQMTFGFSRDDVGSFLPDYLKDNLLEADPFQTIDQQGVGQLIKFSVERGRHARRSEDRHLRRAGGRSGVGRVLLQERADLRELFALPRADRAAGRRPRRPEGQEVEPRGKSRSSHRSQPVGVGGSNGVVPAPQAHGLRSVGPALETALFAASLPTGRDPLGGCPVGVGGSNGVAAAPKPSPCPKNGEETARLEHTPDSC